MAWGEGIGSQESLGGAMAGAGAGAAFGPWGALAGGTLGLLMGGSSSAKKKRARKAETDLAAKSSELSPWLSNQAQQSSAGVQRGDTEQQMASPWIGAAALAKAYKEQQDMAQQQKFLQAQNEVMQEYARRKQMPMTSAWSAPVSAYQARGLYNF